MLNADAALLLYIIVASYVQEDAFSGESSADESIWEAREAAERDESCWQVFQTGRKFVRFSHFAADWNIACEALENKIHSAVPSPVLQHLEKMHLLTGLIAIC